MTTMTTQPPASMFEPAPEPKRVTRVSGRTKKKARKGAFTAATADIHELYQLAVQHVESEIDFVDEQFEKIRGRRASLLREDFCGTGNTACEWVRRRKTNRAIGLDIDQPTLDWGIEHNVAPLKPEQRQRVQLLNRNVLKPGDAVDVDVVLAMNFSYWLFMTRDAMRGYFESVRRSLGSDGVFFLDFYGGYEAGREMTEEREIDEGAKSFIYIWDQHRYDPISGHMQCFIHFKFPDKTKIKHAFAYNWRLWTLPEIQELLAEAGFKKVTIFWEGADEDGEGNGEFEPVTKGDADPAFICYLVAEK
ncbi:MAG: class I SAM-dependent methyltransferase [Phycisphaerales bacterium]